MASCDCWNKNEKEKKKSQLEDLYSNVACKTAWIAFVSYTPKENKIILCNNNLTFKQQILQPK